MPAKSGTFDLEVAKAAIVKIFEGGNSDEIDAALRGLSDYLERPEPVPGVQHMVLVNRLRMVVLAFFTRQEFEEEQRLKEERHRLQPKEGYDPTDEAAYNTNGCAITALWEKQQESTKGRLDACVSALSMVAGFPGQDMERGFSAQDFSRAVVSDPEDSLVKAWGKLRHSLNPDGPIDHLVFFSNMIEFTTSLERLTKHSQCSDENLYGLFEVLAEKYGYLEMRVENTDAFLSVVEGARGIMRNPKDKKKHIPPALYGQIMPLESDSRQRFDCVSYAIKLYFIIVLVGAQEGSPQTVLVDAKGLSQTLAGNVYADWGGEGDYAEAGRLLLALLAPDLRTEAFFSDWMLDHMQQLLGYVIKNSVVTFSHDRHQKIGGLLAYANELLTVEGHRNESPIERMVAFYKYACMSDEQGHGEFHDIVLRIADSIPGFPKPVPMEVIMEQLFESSDNSSTNEERIRAFEATDFYRACCADGYKKDTDLDHDLTSPDGANTLAPAVDRIPFQAVRDNIHLNTGRFVLFFAKLLNWFRAVIRRQKVSDDTLKGALRKDFDKSDVDKRWTKRPPRPGSLQPDSPIVGGGGSTGNDDWNPPPQDGMR